MLAIGIGGASAVQQLLPCGMNRTSGGKPRRRLHWKVLGGSL